MIGKTLRVFIAGLGSWPGPGLAVSCECLLAYPGIYDRPDRTVLFNNRTSCGNLELDPARSRPIVRLQLAI